MNKIAPIIVSLLFLFLSFLGGLRLGKGAPSRLQPRDTVFVTKTITEYLPSPKEENFDHWDISVPKYVFLDDIREYHDSVFVPVVVHDSIYVPINNYYYEELDGRLRLWASGYNVNIDKFELDDITKIVRYRDKWGFSVTAGPGLMLTPFHKCPVDAGFAVVFGASYTF